MSQKWNMFSPTVMRTEKWVVADIEFMNGETTSLFINNEKVYDKFNRNYFENVNQFWRKFLAGSISLEIRSILKISDNGLEELIIFLNMMVEGQRK